MNNKEFKQSMVDEMRSYGIQILPEGTRVFVRDYFLFGNFDQKVGKVIDFLPNRNSAQLGFAEVEYYVEFKNGYKVWIPSAHIEGFLRRA